MACRPRRRLRPPPQPGPSLQADRSLPSGKRSHQCCGKELPTARCSTSHRAAPPAPPPRRPAAPPRPRPRRGSRSVQLCLPRANCWGSAAVARPRPAGGTVALGVACCSKKRRLTLPRSWERAAWPKSRYKCVTSTDDTYVVATHARTHARRAVCCAALRPPCGRHAPPAAPMSALFDFRSFLTILLLSICSCTYVKMRAPQVRTCPPLLSRLPALTRMRSYPQLLDPYRTGPRGVLWKLARRAPERASQLLSLRSRSPPLSASAKD